MKEYLYNGLRDFALAMILPLTLVSGACEVRLPKTNPEPTCKTSEGQEVDCEELPALSPPDPPQPPEPDEEFCWHIPRGGACDDPPRELPEKTKGEFVRYLDFSLRLKKIDERYDALNPNFQKSNRGLPLLKFEGNTAYYFGATEQEEYRWFIHAVQKYGKPIKKLVIKSEGGNTLYGKLLGLWVYENKIDVQVRDVCFSSCANYIFPAGKKKYIEDNAFVGWHGNILQIMIDGTLAEDTPENRRKVQESLQEQWRQHFRKDGRENVEALVKERLDIGIAEQELEREFFRLIGVNEAICYQAAQPDRSLSQHEMEINRMVEKTGKPLRLLGFTLSIKSMEHFGVTNIIYLGDGRYPERKTYDGLTIPEAGL